MWLISLFYWSQTAKTENSQVLAEFTKFNLAATAILVVLKSQNNAFWNKMRHFELSFRKKKETWKFHFAEFQNFWLKKCKIKHSLFFCQKNLFAFWFKSFWVKKNVFYCFLLKKRSGPPQSVRGECVLRCWALKAG